MAVKYIQTSPVTPQVANNAQFDRQGFTSGYTHCMQEVFRHLGSSQHVTEETKLHLYCHLNSVINSSDTHAQTPSPHMHTTPLNGFHDAATTAPTNANVNDANRLHQNHLSSVFDQHVQRNSQLIKTETPQEFLTSLQNFGNPTPSINDCFPSSNSSPDDLDTRTSFPDSFACTPNGFNMNTMEWYRGQTEWSQYSPEMSTSGGSDVAPNCQKSLTVMDTTASSTDSTSSSSSSMWRPW